MLRAEFTGADGLARRTCGVGCSPQPGTYPAWVRFSGPGPYWPPDLEDLGQCSVGIKVMGVPGDKLLDDEQRTQDLILVSPASFVTPNIRENAKMQRWVRAKAPIVYAIKPGDSPPAAPVHAAALLADARQPARGAVLQQRPLPARRGSGSPVLPQTRASGAAAGSPCKPTDNYLRDAMVRTLAAGDWEMDFMVQVQTDPHLMPIEDATVKWPERLSPYIPVARLRLLRQRFDSDEQLAVRRCAALQPVAQPAGAQAARQLQSGPSADVCRARRSSGSR